MEKDLIGSSHRLGILGGGQLGRMFIQEAISYNIHVHIMENDTNAPSSSIATSMTLGDITNYDDVLDFGKDKDVIIIEDIVDTGHTIEKIISLLNVKKPNSVEICTLLYKPAAFKGTSKPIYVGFDIPNAFVVGYGLDYNEKGRNLDALYQIRENKN